MHNPIFHRRSIRKFQDKAVEQEKIELLLRAAMAAPSACNQQPWEYYVVTDKDTILKLSKCSHFSSFAAKAPLMFVPCARKINIAPKFNDIDMSASVENLLLEADLQGLGATWIGVSPMAATMKAVAEVLSLPATLSPFAMIACGYPAEEKEPVDRYSEKRVHYIR